MIVCTTGQPGPTVAKMFCPRSPQPLGSAGGPGMRAHLKTGTVTGPHALPRAHNQKPRTSEPLEIQSSTESIEGPPNPWLILRASSQSDHFGWGTTRMYGFTVFHPPGYFFAASSFETEPLIMTSSPGFQFTGVET
jgi:hypothetical protein